MALKRITYTRPLKQMHLQLKLQRVGRRAGCEEVSGVSLDETASSVDLGGRRKIKKKNFEGRRGERFHVNSSWTWVSRS